MDEHGGQVARENIMASSTLSGVESIKTIQNNTNLPDSQQIISEAYRLNMCYENGVQPVASC